MRAIGEHDGRASCVGRRRHPGVETRRGRRQRRAEAECRHHAVPRAVADDAEQQHDREHQQGADGERVAPVGARAGTADAQAPNELGQP